MATGRIPQGALNCQSIEPPIQLVTCLWQIGSSRGGHSTCHQGRRRQPGARGRVGGVTKYSASAAELLLSQRPLDVGL